MLRSVRGWALESVAGFEVAYVTSAGAEGRVPLAEAWALPLERGEPVRRFPSYKGQRHLPGLWWSATDGRHVGSSPGSNGIFPDPSDKAAIATGMQ